MFHNPAGQAILPVRQAFCIHLRLLPVSPGYAMQNKPAAHTHLCILIAGIFPGDRVFSFQGSAEEVHLLPLTPEKTVERGPPGKEKS